MWNHIKACPEKMETLTRDTTRHRRQAKIKWRLVPAFIGRVENWNMNQTTMHNTTRFSCPIPNTVPIEKSQRLDPEAEQKTDEYSSSSTFHKQTKMLQGANYCDTVASAVCSDRLHNYRWYIPFQRDGLSWALKSPMFTACLWDI
jgi:hypothetical protein